MNPDNNNDDDKSQAHQVSKILNYVGGTLIFFGVTYLLFNNWLALATAGRIVITLGLSIWAFMVGISFSKNPNTKTSSAVCFALGSLLLPLGLYVTINAINPHLAMDTQKIFITGISTFILVTLQICYQRSILLFFCIIFGSLFFIDISNYFYYGHLYYQDHLNRYDSVWDYYQPDNLNGYQEFILGLFYIAIGYYQSLRTRKLTGILFFVGDLLVLMSSFYLGGLLFYNHGTIEWELIAPLMVIMSFILYLLLKHKSFMFLGSLFLIIYISSVTKKFAYLFGNLGWPVILIGGGILLILFGFLVMHFSTLNQKPAKQKRLK